MKFNKELFATELFAFKMKTGLSIREFSEKYKIDKSFISRIFNNKTNPDIDNILAVCTLLEKPIDYFIINQ